jgi:hypothetical protein
MRDFSKLPLTDFEICSALKELADERLVHGVPLVGDMPAIILLTAADIIASPKQCNHHGIISALLRNNAELRAVAVLAADCIHDDRHVGGEVSFKMGGHRRIRLADALKKVVAPDDLPKEDHGEQEVQHPRQL